MARHLQLLLVLPHSLSQKNSVSREFIKIRIQNASRNRNIVTLNNFNNFKCFMVTGKTKQ